MKHHPRLKREIRIHSPFNPGLLVLAFLFALGVGLFLEKSVFSRVTINDRSMSPTLKEGKSSIVCRLSLCKTKVSIGDLFWINTTDRDKIRRVGALPGEEVQLQNHPIYPKPNRQEPSDLKIPQKGELSDLHSWSPLAFDALFPILVQELDSLDRTKLRIRIEWSNEEEFIEEQFESAFDWSRYVDLERRTSLLKSHRAGQTIRWQRRLFLAQEPLCFHQWQNDYYLFEPTSTGWSWWVLPQENILGKVIITRSLLPTR